MTSDIKDLSPSELNLLALGLDFLICNGSLAPGYLEEAEELFATLDLMCDDLEQRDSSTRLRERRDNLLVVDFSPKNG